MKRLLISLIFLLTFSAVTFAQSDDWVYLGKTDDGKKFWYQSTSVVEIDKHTFKYWDKMMFPTPLEDGTAYFLTLNQVKCDIQQSRYTRIVSYDKNDKMISDFDYSDKTYKDVVPGTVAADNLRTICNKYDK